MKNLTETAISQSDLNNDMLCTLYSTAFPAEEQIPWTDLMSLIDRMSLDFTAYYDDEMGLVGLTIVYPSTDFNWFWYFAVKEELRGHGLGEQILKRVLSKYADTCLILDMESPEQECSNTEQRHRRHDFYSRNGFRDTDVFRKYGEIEMTVMMTGDGTFTLQDWDNITDELKQFWWRGMPTDS